MFSDFSDKQLYQNISKVQINMTGEKSNGFDSNTGKDSLGFKREYYSKSTKIGIIADIQYAGKMCLTFLK